MRDSELDVVSVAANMSTLRLRVHWKDNAYTISMSEHVRFNKRVGRDYGSNTAAIHLQYILALSP